jgi:hypothetical protein
MKNGGGAELRALRYDIRGDRAQFKASIDDYAWNTTFD